MWKKAYFLALALIVLAVNASAACIYSPAVGTPVVYFEPYSAACIQFKWTHAQTANDFNNYIIHATGEVGIEDVNLGAASNSFKVCGISPGHSETFFVKAFDGNASAGRVCSFDANITATVGSEIQGIQYLVYQVFTVTGMLVILIILVAVAGLVLMRFKFQNIFK